MTIEKKLKELRIQWTKYPEKRKSIELQARVLQMKAKEQEDDSELLYNVRKTLL